MLRIPRFHVSPVALTVAVALWVVLFCNYSFFSRVLDVYPLEPENAGFILSLGVLLSALTVVLLSVFAETRVMKPLLIAFLILAAVTAYFMDTYHVIISSELVESALETDSSESLGLFNLKLIAYVFLLGVLPGILVWRTDFPERRFRTAVLSRVKLLVASLIIAVVTLVTFNSAYASFFREHKSIRFYTNPITPIYTAVKFADEKWGGDESVPYRHLGLDATQRSSDHKRRLVIMVVGETARADHFSLNGYAHDTNPLLKKEQVASFANVWACGTATAVSVPCMFSVLDRASYEGKVARNTDNVLDIIDRAGVNVIWLDNNSDSKGVADRIAYVSYRNRDVNPDCDTECRDPGMLAGVKDYVAKKADGDILVVLHQMGSHGPEYAKRYPRARTQFSPVCESNLLENCSEDEIRNAYDNSILYTDYFLSQVIEYLKSESDEFAPAMLYLSDHGESLGDNGIYLHGFPYAFAPDEQKHVPMIFWSGEGYDRAQRKLAQKGFLNKPFSQNNLFHTLLGLLEVNTSVYRADLDIFANG